jgi:hypothetical protein
LFGKGFGVLVLVGFGVDVGVLVGVLVGAVMVSVSCGSVCTVLTQLTNKLEAIHVNMMAVTKSNTSFVFSILCCSLNSLSNRFTQTLNRSNILE